MEFSEIYHFEQFADLTQELFLALDRTGTVVYINQTGCDMLKDKHENILGQNWFDNFFDKSTNQEVKSVYLELVNGNIEFAHHFENTIITRQKESLLISWNNRALYDENGKINYILSSGRDISKVRECESKLNTTTLALEAAIEELKSI